MCVSEEGVMGDREHNVREREKKKLGVRGGEWVCGGREREGEKVFVFVG